MTGNVPFYVSAVMALSTFLSVYFIYKAAGNSKTVLVVLFFWLAIQALISYAGFYLNTHTLPPRFALAIGPPLLVIIFLFGSKRGKHFIDSLNSEYLTLLHVVRVPVELVLFWLFVHEAVPQHMTFEGWNFDILSGLTAPLVWYFGYKRKVLSRKLFLFWNVVCLALLVTIVVISILAAPSPFQQIAFEQPNIGVLHFPFIWLPCCIVPLVLFSHLALLKSLHKNATGKGTVKI